METMNGRVGFAKGEEDVTGGWGLEAGCWVLNIDAGCRAEEFRKLNSCKLPGPGIQYPAPGIRIQYAVHSPISTVHPFSLCIAGYR